MNYFDYLIIGIVGFSLVTGLFRGLIKEAISLGVWIVALWAATSYTGQLENMLSAYISSPTIRTGIMYGLIGVGVLLSGAILNAFVGIFISKSGLGAMDTILGATFGFARGCLIVALILLVIRVVNLPTGGMLAGSSLAPKFYPLVNWLYQYVPNMNDLDLTSLFDKMFSQSANQASDFAKSVLEQ